MSTTESNAKAVKVASYRVANQGIGPKANDAFTSALNVAPCASCGTMVAWLCSGSRGNESAGTWIAENAKKHCPTCSPDGKNGAFRVRAAIDGDVIALRVADSFEYVAPAKSSEDAINSALDKGLAAFQRGEITAKQYAELAAALGG